MFGNESYSAIVKVMHLREQMRPYVMSQYQAAAAHGTPIMRPLFFDFFDDEPSQHVEDQQMFGPDYLVAPVLQKGVTSRRVYLPPLPKGTVWRNVFTDVETDTSAGGMNITEGTPLDTFPLYRRHVTWRYPTPAPAPPCDDSCKVANFANSTDIVAPQMYSHFNSSTASDCCAKCKADASCTAFVWGPYDAPAPTGPLSCFLMKNKGISVVHKASRTFGCVRT
jgi:hypothetical protein